jgi:hypothetical protein
MIWFASPKQDETCIGPQSALLVWNRVWNPIWAIRMVLIVADELFHMHSTTNVIVPRGNDVVASTPDNAAISGLLPSELDKLAIIRYAQTIRRGFQSAPQVYLPVKIPTTADAKSVGDAAPEIRVAWQSAIDGVPRDLLTNRDVATIVVGDGDEKCTICLDAFTDDSTVHQMVQCLHVYHWVCIKNWLRLHNRCPCCNGAAIRRSPLETHTHTHTRYPPLYLSCRSDSPQL